MRGGGGRKREKAKERETKEEEEGRGEEENAHGELLDTRGQVTLFNSHGQALWKTLPISPL